MLSIKRSDPEARIELMPLIDVIFLILTFFIYAMVLMVQVDVLPVPMESYISGEAADPVPATSITLDLDGSVYVGQVQVELAQVLPEVQRLLEASPDTAIYIVMAAGDADIDRGPILTSLWDHLRESGIEIKLVGAPTADEPLDGTTP